MRKQLPKISNDEMTLQVNDVLKWLDTFREEMEIKEKKRLKILNEMLYILDNLEPIETYDPRYDDSDKSDELREREEFTPDRI